MVEKLDVFDYTGVAESGDTIKDSIVPSLRFEVDGIRSAYGMNNKTSMEVMLKASKRAATYHGSGAPGGPLSAEEVKPCYY